MNATVARGLDMGSERKREKREGEGRHARPSPVPSEAQESPEPERPPTPDEEAGQSLEELEEPPQAEGPRDRD